MNISPKKPYLVTLEEPPKNQYVTIKYAEMIIYASDIIEACKTAEEYFGMGTDVNIIKCELINKSQ